jgi:type IV pilus assembly protein PilN
MIKVNLAPIKRKKKAKPIPTFLILMVFVTIVAGFLSAFIYFHFNSKLSMKKSEFANNENTISDLNEKIKAVDNFEQLNNTFRERNGIIEQLSKNKSLPVKLLDDISGLLPGGVWLQTMTVSGNTINISGYGFTNPDIVAYIDNIKNSNKFGDVALQESKSTDIQKIPVYMFRLIITMKG